MTGAGDIRAFVREHRPTVRVELVHVRGSAPREAGAWMLVGRRSTFGTIGGGQLEYMAIDRARSMLRDGVEADVLDVPLGPEIGQCCGGRVEIGVRTLDERLASECIAAEEKAFAARPRVYLFGAGHVGGALASALSLLPVHVLVADTRAAELEKIAEGIETRLTPMPETLVREAPPGSAFVVLTHDHSLDFLITAEALARDDAAYAGMIGSKTKRATFSAWYLKNAGSEARLERLVCPIGRPASGDKRPAVIAAFAAAEIMDALSSYERPGVATGAEAARIS
jgi:xanthine dehydrogenase accessory factor